MAYARRSPGSQPACARRRFCYTIVTPHQFRPAAKDAAGLSGGEKDPGDTHQCGPGSVKAARKKKTPRRVEGKMRERGVAFLEEIGDRKSTSMNSTHLCATSLLSYA